jgi:hypothetical protein
VGTTTVTRNGFRVTSTVLAAFLVLVVASGCGLGASSPSQTSKGPVNGLVD